MYELLVRVLFTLRMCSEYIQQTNYNQTNTGLELTDIILLCSIYELPKNTAVPTFTSTSCSLRVPALVYVRTRAVEKHVDFCLQVLGLVLLLVSM